jgi:hypothetical protein
MGGGDRGESKFVGSNFDENIFVESLLMQVHNSIFIKNVLIKSKGNLIQIFEKKFYC